MLIKKSSLWLLGLIRQHSLILWMLVYSLSLSSIYGRRHNAAISLWPNVVYTHHLWLRSTLAPIELYKRSGDPYLPDKTLLTFPTFCRLTTALPYPSSSWLFAIFLSKTNCIILTLVRTHMGMVLWHLGLKEFGQKQFLFYIIAARVEWNSGFVYKLKCDSHAALNSKYISCFSALENLL